MQKHDTEGCDIPVALTSRDTFISIMKCLPPEKVLAYRTVCKKWKEFIDGHPWQWEPVEEIKKAKFWKFVLGKPKVGIKYSAILQLGELRHPSECMFALAREEDNVIELKEVTKTKEGWTANLMSELNWKKNKISRLSEFSKTNVMCADVAGNILLWDIHKNKIVDQIVAHDYPITTLTCTKTIVKKADTDTTGFMLSQNVVNIVSGDEKGILKCWVYDDGFSECWSIKHDRAFPVRSIRQSTQDEILVAFEDTANKKFHIATYSIKDGSELKKPYEVRFGMAYSEYPLKELLLFNNRNVIPMRLSDSPSRQFIYICNNKWNGESHKPEKSSFAANEKGGEWLKSQSYVLSSGNFLFLSGKNGHAVVGLPRRLPVTQYVEKSEDSEDSMEMLGW